MRISGCTGPLLLALGLVGCGPANSLEEGVPDDAVYVPPPKIEFAKPKSATRHATKPTAATPTTTTDAKKQ